jgi:hypothetical protein
MRVLVLGKRRLSVRALGIGDGKKTLPPCLDLDLGQVLCSTSPTVISDNRRSPSVSTVKADFYYSQERKSNKKSARRARPVSVVGAFTIARAYRQTRIMYGGRVLEADTIRIMPIYW